MRHAARALLALAAAPALAGQTFGIEHFSQRGKTLAALASEAEGGAPRAVAGGLLLALRGPPPNAEPPSQELLLALAKRVDAVALGPDELLALSQLRAARGDALPLIACNVFDQDGKQVLPGHVVRESNGNKLAFVGLTAPSSRTPELPVGWRIDEPIRALEKALPEARKSAAHVVLLTTLGTPEVLELLVSVRDLDLVIALGSRGADPEPVRIGATWVCASASGGQALAILSARAEGGKLVAVTQRFTPALLRESEQQSLARLDDLRAAAPAPLAASRASSPMNPVGSAVRSASRESRGLAGAGVDAAAVNRAIERGSQALWKQIKEWDLRSPEVAFGSQEQHWLAALAFVHSKAHRKNREIDGAIRGALASVVPRKLGTYAAGVVCMLVEDLGDPRYFPQLREAARMLVESQGPRGSWGYGMILPDEIYDSAAVETPLVVNGGRALDDPEGTTERWQRITAWDSGSDGDNSTSQFALLGLRSASRLGIRIPAETWRRALRSYCGYQGKAGGWAYDYPDDARSYGSMTLAGISALAICRHELALRDPGVDARLAKAVDWLAERFAVDKNPNERSYLGYYLYSLERTGRILETEHFGEQEWYPLGCKQLLVMQQKDGLWSMDSVETDPRLATSYALLFLTRATATLNVTVERGGKGFLRADVAIPPKERVYFVLDASGSMLEALGAGSKFDAARAALARTVGSLAPGSRVALRAYGHRRRAIEPDADSDSELLLPLSPLDHEAFGKKLQALRARGKTPLALSLQEAANDLKATATAEAPTVVVLLSDGGEDTQPRRDPVAAAKALAALPGVILHVVGFDIGRDDWKAQLAAIAQAGKGSYRPAAKGDDLAKTVREAFLRCPDGFLVLDMSGKQVAKGVFGEQVELDEGRYRFRTEYDGKTWECALWVNTGRTSSVSFDGARLRAR